MLNTNVVSEIWKPRPAPSVAAWVRSVPRSDCYTSIFVLAEIGDGVACMNDLPARVPLQLWLDAAIPRWFENRILAVDQAVANIWTEMNTRGRRANHTFPQPDLIIAATAIRYGLTVATRNVRDFAPMGVALFNPWDGSSPAP